MSKELDALKKACKAAVCEFNLATENEDLWHTKRIEAGSLVRAKEKLLLKATAAEFVAAHKGWKASKDTSFDLDLHQALTVRSKYANAYLTAIDGDVVWVLELDEDKLDSFKSAEAMLKALEPARRNRSKRKKAETACRELMSSTVDKMIGLLAATGGVSKSDLLDPLIDEINQREEINK